jgi:hypothetical protein
MLHPASPEISISDLFVDDDWPTLDGFIPIPVDYEEAEMEEPEPEPESELQQPPELQQESEADTYQRGFETASITTSSSMRSSPDRPVLGTPIRLPVSTPSDDSEAEINDVEFDAALWPSNLTPSSPDPENENEWMLHGEKDTTTFVRNTSGPRTPRAALTKAEEPPPGFKGKARRQPNEECRQFLWEWNNSKDRLSDNPELHSAIFQAFAGMSISHDNMQEADAPEVTVDTSAKAAPPFEFFYSNDVMYHPDVPEPELGAGCGCEGPCDPNNDRCLCAKRQSLYFYTTGLQGFNYDK